MLNLNRTAILILSAVLAAGASAKSPADTAADYGYIAADSATERTIVVTPATKYVNVANGETVKFSVGGKSFNWHVSTYNNVNVFALATIAPQDVAANGVKVYVAPNPLYVGN